MGERGRGTQRGGGGTQTGAAGGGGRGDFEEGLTQPSA